ncbi:ABC transporter substrate-binding protein (plasmid) [Agrobacterium leguminum]|uniref:ABC transporter substrate-binding protein n=1 Tax=Agrobacterium leguminum TaxID=2792015 RepID=UPI00272B0053|nr:ABC transporter substrate-binding protein [Agrobacterium leguminum]WLE00812.1 ABC transporter substrate-binding protein [Agrobacterium leguminum]
MKLSSLLGAIAFMALTPSLALADGTAPNYGKCSPRGQAHSIEIKTVESDTLTVATVLPNPGWYNGVTPKSVEDGYEYCLAAEIAHRAGLKNLKLLNLAWDQYISGTAKGYDIATASTTITEARKQIFDFTRPYFSSNLGVAVLKGAEVNAGNIRAKRIGVLQGNMGSDWVAGTLKPDSAVSFYQAQADMVAALMARQVDAIVSDTTLVLSATAGSNGAIEVVGQYKMDQGYGVITPKGSDNSSTVDAAVGAMIDDGTLNELSARFLAPIFKVDPNSVPVWQLQ